MLRPSIFLALLVTAGVLPAAEVSWPGFLGAGVDLAGSDPPVTWSPKENVAWTTELPGVGQSTPVVADGVAYVTQVLGETKESVAVIAIDLADGSEKWRYEAPSSRQEKVSLYVSLSAPSPVVDGNAVYAWFETGDLVAVGHDGEALWSKNVLADLDSFAIRHGLAGSLVQVDDKIFVLIDQEGPSALMAFDKTDGATLWSTPRETTTAWSSPFVITVDGKPQIVTSGAGTIAGYDAADGRELWKIDGVGGNNVPTPLPFADGKFLIGANGGRSGESSAAAAETNGAYEIVATDDGYEAKRLWNTDEATVSFNSPAPHAGYGYWINRVGALWCLDLATGERAYRGRVDCGSCWATPVGVGDRVYLPGRTGKTTVLAAGPDFDELATNTLFEASEDGGPFGGETVYALVVVDDTLLFRTGAKLYLVRDDAE
ncbi:MAG: PQQ-binding-like beta-propeller repeat protein [Planctomycetota bacterium]